MASILWKHYIAKYFMENADLNINDFLIWYGLSKFFSKVLDISSRYISNFCC